MTGQKSNYDFFLIINLLTWFLGAHMHGVQHKNSSGRKKTMTILVYAAADNDLDPYIDFNQNQAQREGVSEDLNLLFFTCTHRENEGKLATKSIIKKREHVIIEKIPGLDSGHKNTLKVALEWAEEYTSDYLGVILWDHGFWLDQSFNYGVCHDKTTGNRLSDRDLQEVFASRKKTIDFIGFDACFCASIEVAYALAPYARYLVASEQSISNGGWPYNLIIRAFKQGKTAPEDFLPAVVQSYKTYYNPLTQNYTLSVIDLSKFSLLADTLQALIKILTECCKKEKNTMMIRAAVKSACEHAFRFDEESFVDVYDWYLQLKKHIATLQGDGEMERLVLKAKKLIEDGMESITKCVVASVSGALCAQSNGIHFYLPRKHVSRAYSRCYWAKTTHWTQFLQAALGVT